MENGKAKKPNPLLEKIRAAYSSGDLNRPTYLPVDSDEFGEIIPLIPDLKATLIGLFAVENFADKAGISLFYVLEQRGSSNLVILQRSLEGSEGTSVAEYFPSACWFEREVRDGFGIEFRGAFDRRPLFLHEAYPAGFHPLLKSFENKELPRVQPGQASSAKYQFKEVAGEGVYNVLVGPVHAGIIEPGHFHFSVIGETIANLEVRMFYKHRGIEKLAEEKTPEQCVSIAESISGDETIANAVAYCLAVEKIVGVKVPVRAWHLRTIFLEMERIYSHLGDLAGMLIDVAFPLGASAFQVLREEILRYNEILTGSRFMKGAVALGGLCRDVPPRHLLTLSGYLAIFVRRLTAAVKFIHQRDSVLDRLETTGVITRGIVDALNITGPAARASGVAIDTRLDHPYGIYSGLDLVKRTSNKGDVLSRFEVKTAEILDSVAIIQNLIEEINSGPIISQFQVKDGCGISLVEAPRGQTLQWVYLKNGLIERYKVRTASFCNWQAIEHAVMGNIVPDFPLINKSLNLSYAGTDL